MQHLHLWDQDVVLRSYLEKEREPHPDRVDPRITVARLALTKIHLNALKDTSAQIIPRQSDALALETAGASFRYKVLAWKAFQVNHLPTEILQYIFRLVVLPRDHRAVIDTSRLRLTWVCQRWRDIAVSYPLLWNIIYFRGANDSTWKKSMYLVLHRSGQAPLEIHVADQQHWNNYGRDVAKKITHMHIHLLFNTLSQRANTIRALTFKLDRADAFAQAMTYFHTAAQFRNPPNLELFKIHGSPGMQLPFPLRTPLLGGVAPRLSHFGVSGISIDLNNFHFTENLTRLDLGGMPLSAMPTSRRFLEILSSAPNLTFLSLDRTCPKVSRQTHAPYGPPVHLPKLNTLLISNLSYNDTLYSLYHFTAPNLKVLSFCITSFRGEERDDGSLSRFLRGRFPAVTTLLLTGLKWDTTGAAQRAAILWLDSMPGITYLKLCNMGMRNLTWFSMDSEWFHVQEKLAIELASIGKFMPGGRPYFIEEERRGPRPVVLPKLHYLVVDQLSEEKILEFVKRRWEAGHPPVELVLCKKDMLSTSTVELMHPALGICVKAAVPPPEDPDTLVLDY